MVVQPGEEVEVDKVVTSRESTRDIKVIKITHMEVEALLKMTKAVAIMVGKELIEEVGVSILDNHQVPIKIG